MEPFDAAPHVCATQKSPDLRQQIIPTNPSFILIWFFQIFVNNKNTSLGKIGLCGNISGRVYTTNRRKKKVQVDFCTPSVSRNLS
jgi:hypothetical protein